MCDDCNRQVFRNLWWIEQKARNSNLGHYYFRGLEEKFNKAETR